MNTLDDGHEQQPAVPAESIKIDHQEEEVAVIRRLGEFLPINVPENEEDLNIPEKCPDDLWLPVMIWPLSKGANPNQDNVFSIMHEDFHYFEYTACQL
jgi:hypothetical protein